MTDRQRLVEQLMRHEGIRSKPYRDSVGKLTIGCGRNLTDVGLSDDEIFYLLANDIDAVMQDLATFPWFAGLDPVRQRVLCDLRFNLGPNRFRGFKRMLQCLAVLDYAGAARELQDSRWYMQVGTRGPRLVEMLKTGDDYKL